MAKVVNKPPKTARTGCSQKPGTGFSRVPTPKGGLKGGQKK
jgi:hypothetical protein